MELPKEQLSSKINITGNEENKTDYQISDLLELFENTLSPADILTAKITAQISTAITEERLKLHMTQSQFAKHIHASQSLISRWERGDYNFSIRKIAEIASALNVDVHFSFYNANEHAYSSDVDHKNYPPYRVSDKEGMYHHKYYESPDK